MAMLDDLKQDIEGFDVRFTEASDAQYLKKWLMDPEVEPWFPMTGEREIEDSVKRWIGFSRLRCSLTGMLDGEAVGMCTLYLQYYKKLLHQCEFGIIVGKEGRGKGVGTQMMRNLMHLAKTRFNVAVLHLQVYDENPAIRLYERLGFVEFGRQARFLKEKDGYRARIFMERYLDD